MTQGVLFNMEVLHGFVSCTGASAVPDWGYLPIRLFPSRSRQCDLRHTRAGSARVPATTALASVGRQLAITVADLRGAAVASPAAWRLHEETDRLEAEYEVLDQLHTAFAAKEGATPASPAQWRAQESTDSLCEQLLGD